MLNIRIPSRACYHLNVVLNSQIAKDYRVADVPSCFVIDQEGKIAQIDLFGATLKKYIQEKLR